MGSGIEVPATWAVWRGGDLRTYEPTCRVCVGLEVKSRWRFLVSVQAWSVPDGRFIWSSASLYGSKSFKTLCFRPNIALFLGDRWELPDPSGTLSLICLHIWKVLDIRLNICERYCVTPNVLSGRSGQSWQLKSSGNGVFRHLNLWNMPTLGTTGRQNIQALFVLLLAFLSQALGLLKTSMGSYDGDDCGLQD